MKKNLYKIFLWIFIGLISLGQFQRIEMSGGLSGVNIYFHDIFIILWLGFFLFKNLKSIHLFENIIILLSAIALTFNHIFNLDFIAILYISRLALYLVFAFSLRGLIIFKKMDHNTLRFKFFGAGLIILVLGFLQLLFIEDTRFLSILGWDDHYHRLISTIFDPGFTGIILVITYFYFLSLKKFINNRFINVVIELSILWGIALTFSRASYLALAIALIFLFFKQRKASKSAIISLIIFVFFAIISPKPGGEGVNLSRTASIKAREGALRSQLESISLKTILVGNGLFSIENGIGTPTNNQYGIPSHSRMPDNIFVNLLLSTGVFGLILSTFFGVKLLVKLSRSDYYMTAALIALLIHAQFSNSVFQPFVLLIILGGLASSKKVKA